MLKSRSFTIVDVLMLIVLGMVVVMSLMIGLIPPVMPICLTPALAAVFGAVLIFLKDRRKPTPSMGVAASIMLFVIGISWLGFGGMMLALPSDETLVTDLTIFFLFCAAPGALAALTGLGSYWYMTQYEEEAGEGATAVSAAAKEKQWAQANENIRRYEEQWDRAHLYYDQILDVVAEKQSSAVGEKLDLLVAELDEWQERVERLVERLIAFEENPVLQRDMTAVPAAIQKLEGQMARETDPEIRREMEETLQGYREQQEQLDDLTRLMRRTELNLEETLAAMGTMYSQLQVLDAMTIDGSRARRLAHEIDEQVAMLSDLLAAVEEVYADTGYHLRP